ncbi:hypothetical protein DU62_15990 [Methanosarcina mazei]|uniref:Uncharacterized protein n=1 Tax=Methanosarcina mazei TaxID=2209 RepID=A0A0F8JIQ4_METMZ|nr:hypothetical protein DU46_17705 [Methanosarcina mazei]KKG84515.1 hypothetical protein DU61_18295 [Methanosarcina mazei]KKH07218.1 hypothetical protein DU62_15990 [Methanosarcina mazei]KKH09963.1 hypothetical protein DU51_00580 [Methanosarcina mazei]
MDIEGSFSNFLLFSEFESLAIAFRIEDMKINKVIEIDRGKIGIPMRSFVLSRGFENIIFHKSNDINFQEFLLMFKIFVFNLFINNIKPKLKFLLFCQALNRIT